MEEQIKVNDSLEVKENNGGTINMPKGVNALRNQDATIVVNRTWPPNQRQIKLQIRPFVTEVAKISVAKGLTINAGNYNSIKVDVIVTLPCYIEEINETYQYAKQLSEMWIKQEETYIQEEIKKLHG